MMNKSQEGRENKEKRRWWLLGKLEWRVCLFFNGTDLLKWLMGKKRTVEVTGGGC